MERIIHLRRFRVEISAKQDNLRGKMIFAFDVHESLLSQRRRGARMGGKVGTGQNTIYPLLVSKFTHI
jgi:hypothetical protein